VSVKAAGHSKETKAQYYIYNIKNIFQVAPALTSITSYLHSCTPPAILYLPPDPLTGKALLQDDLRDHYPPQEGPGVQDRAVEPQYRRDHLPQDQGQVQPLDQASHAQDHEADRQHQRDAAALCEEKGHIFINGRTGKRLTLRHFEKMIVKWAGLLNILKLQSIKPCGREYHLITLMGLREAGERHHDPQWRLMCLRRLTLKVRSELRHQYSRKGWWSGVGKEAIGGKETNGG
jgi:hypothetical protein